MEKAFGVKECTSTLLPDTTHHPEDSSSTTVSFGWDSEGTGSTGKHLAEGGKMGSCQWYSETYSSQKPTEWLIPLH